MLNKFLFCDFSCRLHHILVELCRTLEVILSSLSLLANNA